MYLIFDATTNGKPRNTSRMTIDDFAWPEMIHLSWIVLNEEYKPIEDFNCVIKPEGFIVNTPNLKMAKLEAEDLAKGDKLHDVLNSFNESLKKAQYVFAHNLDFQEKTLSAAYEKKHIANKLISAESYCLMQETTWFCKIPGRNGKYKWPSLTELYALLFKQRYTPANNARADVIAATRCFIMLMKGGILADIFE